MPIPNSVLNNILPFGLSGVSSVYPSLATLRPVTKTTDTTRQINNTFADSVVSGQINLPCRIAPLINIRPQDQEPASGNKQFARARSQLCFASYVNVATMTLLEWQVKVDGVVYQIAAVETDGLKVATRMEVFLAEPFNA